MGALFNDPFLSSQIAMRGGTLLHKVHLSPPSRYSEDIDLVVFGDRPEDHIRKALRRALQEILGYPKASVWQAIQLAIQNVVRPSRVLRMTYFVPSIMEPGTSLTIVVEANVTESFQHYLQKEGSHAGRGEFVAILDSHLADTGFCSDMAPLLRTGLLYDPMEAGKRFRHNSVSLSKAQTSWASTHMVKDFQRRQQTTELE